MTTAGIHAPAAVAGAAPLPTGTITFLFTDIEGSTRGWEANGPRMGDAVARHYEILDAAIAAHGGVRPLEQGEGDSLVAVFAGAGDAVGAALDAQRDLAEEPWPDGMEIVVRMAVHTGEAQLRGALYVGTSLIRCARLRELAHGGQVLVSTTTADLLADGLPDGAALLPLGVHRLRDLRQPQRVFQLAHPALRSHFPPLRSLDVLPNTLPAQLTSFVGRETELAELAGMVGEHRLVTLVGAGGCGKTRLAVQLAADVAERHPDGVWWVDLAPVSDPEDVGRTVMTALGLLDVRGKTLLERITGYLGIRHVLVVADNCEHVIGPVAHLLDGILRACPNVVTIATSREPLGIAGEVAWRVPPLTLPEPQETPSTEQLLGAEAVRLFIDRAVDARPTFRLDAGNAPTVAAICERLDGMPLAIELAAARVRSLSPERILDGLSRRFHLLTGGSRTAPARQQTLQASVEWSHGLLGEEEQALLRRLAAFSGGFSLDAAEEVAAGEPLERWEILTLLSDLVDRSLVTFDGDRYRLLQTIHDFASARLLDAGEEHAVRERHADHFVRMAEEAAADIEATARPETLAAVEGDHENLRAALQWSMDTHAGERALRLVVALTPYWSIRGRYYEALGWCRGVLATVPDEPSTLRVRALWGIGHLGLYGMELTGSYGTVETELAAKLALELGDPALTARTVTDQGALLLFAAPDAGLETLDRAIALGRAAEDEWALASALFLKGFLCVFARRLPDQAAQALDELYQIAVRSGNRHWLGWHGVCQGIAALQEGRIDDACTALEGALAAADMIADPMIEAYSIIWLTDARLAAGHYERAKTLVARIVEHQRRAAPFLRDGMVELGLAKAHMLDGNFDAARRLLDGITAPAHAGNFAACLEMYLVSEAQLAVAQGEAAAALAAAEEAQAIATELGNPWMLVETHHLLGRAAVAQGDTETAETRHHQALTLAVEHGFRGASVEALEALALLAASAESRAEAARLLGAVHAGREVLGLKRWPADERAHDDALAALRSRLGDEAFERSWRDGSALTLEEAAAYASRARGQRKRPSSGWNALTPTELDVIALAAQGLTNAEIGRRLFIAAGTARIHLSHIYAKLDVANRTELAAKATTRGLADRVPQRRG